MKKLNSLKYRLMKKNKIYTLLFTVILVATSCGPVVFTSRPNNPPPSWFYPNRLELVRYVYFPEYSIYFDLTMNNYLYLNNNVWVRVNALPSQYRHIDLNRSKYIRIKNYRSETIRDYHIKNIRSNTSKRDSNTIKRRN